MSKQSKSNDRPLLVIDNYDSFTYNLVQYLRQLGQVVEVHRNDKISIQQVSQHGPKGVLLSPGPGRPQSAGVCLELVEKLSSTLPIFGVCLGHQSIAQAFGAKIISATRLMHGRTSRIEHDELGVFAGLDNPFTATRYHSLIVDESTVSEDFIKSAWSERKELMAIRHKSFPLEGVQFHPESFLTEGGHEMLRNFVNRCDQWGQR